MKLVVPMIRWQKPITKAALESALPRAKLP